MLPPDQAELAGGPPAAQCHPHPSPSSGQCGGTGLNLLPAPRTWSRAQALWAPGEDEDYDTSPPPSPGRAAAPQPLSRLRGSVWNAKASCSWGGLMVDASSGRAAALLFLKSLLLQPPPASAHPSTWTLPHASLASLEPRGRSHTPPGTPQSCAWGCPSVTRCDSSCCSPEVG